MSESLKSKTVSGVLWSAIERFSLQGVQFIINILMARLLLPSDYGMIGMLAVFLQISQTYNICTALYFIVYWCSLYSSVLPDARTNIGYSGYHAEFDIFFFCRCS